MLLKYTFLILCVLIVIFIFTKNDVSNGGGEGNVCVGGNDILSLDVTDIDDAINYSNSEMFALKGIVNNTRNKIKLTFKVGPFRARQDYGSYKLFIYSHVQDGQPPLKNATLCSLGTRTNLPALTIEKINVSLFEINGITSLDLWENIDQSVPPNICTIVFEFAKSAPNKLYLKLGENQFSS